MTSYGQASHAYLRIRSLPTYSDERQLLRDNQPRQLTPKCFDLLVVPVENSGHLIGKDELLQRLWPDSIVEEANLSVNMSALRRALDEDPNEHQYVETVPRRGYRFVAGVRDRWDGGAEVLSQERSEAAGPIADQEQQTSPQLIAGTVTTAHLALAAGYLSWSDCCCSPCCCSG